MEETKDLQYQELGRVLAEACGTIGTIGAFGPQMGAHEAHGTAARSIVRKTTPVVPSSVQMQLRTAVERRRLKCPCVTNAMHLASAAVHESECMYPVHHLTSRRNVCIDEEVAVHNRKVRLLP